MLRIAPGEELLSLPTAIEKATGRRPHVTTCHRWRLNGTNGVKLPTLKVGGRRLTSIEAVHRWIVACNEDEECFSAPSMTRQQARENAKAESYLDAEGV